MGSLRVGRSSVAAAAAKSLQLCPTVRPQRRQLTRLPRPWDSPGKNTGVGCHFLLQCVKVKSLSRVRLLATPWTAAYQALPSIGFSRQEYWSGLPLPSPNIDYRPLLLKSLNMWCWRRLLRVPWTVRRSNQSMLKEINPGISLEGMMLKLKLQYFGHLMRRVDSLEKTLMLRGIGGRRRRG